MGVYRDAKWWVRFHRRQAAVGAAAGLVVLGSGAGFLAASAGSGSKSNVSVRASALTTTTAGPTTATSTSSTVTTVPVTATVEAPQVTAPPSTTPPVTAAPVTSAPVTAAPPTVTPLPQATVPPSTVPAPTRTVPSPKQQLEAWVGEISDPDLSRLTADIEQLNVAFDETEDGPDGPTPQTMATFKQSGDILEQEATADESQPRSPNAQIAADWSSVLQTAATYGSDVGTGLFTHMTPDENAMTAAIQRLQADEAENGINS